MIQYKLLTSPASSPVILPRNETDAHLILDAIKYYEDNVLNKRRTKMATAKKPTKRIVKRLTKTTATTAKRKPGRPKGSLNKAKK